MINGRLHTIHHEHQQSTPNQNDIAIAALLKLLIIAGLLYLLSSIIYHNLPLLHLSYPMGSYNTIIWSGGVDQS